MNALFATIRISFRRQLTYRAANLSGLATNLVFGFFRAAVLIALYNNRTVVNGLSIQAAVTYAGVAQAMIGYMSFFHWYELMHTVYDGQISSDLIKPMNFFLYWLGVDMGRALGSFIIRTLPLFIIFALFFEVVLPNSLLQWSVFILSLLLALLISFAWRFMVNLAAFWTPNALGVGRFAFGLSWIFSGFFMPLALFPDGIALFSRMTPFGASLNIPIEIFLGMVQGKALVNAILLQLFWIIVLITLDHLILNLGVRKLVIQGG
jgi:ABC-2 type transport system permease protein